MCSFALAYSQEPNFLGKSSVADSLHLKGVSSYHNKDYLSAAVLFDSAALLREQLLPSARELDENDRNTLLTAYIKSIHNAGASYMYSDNLQEAQDRTRLSIKRQTEFRELYDFLIPFRLGRSYCQLGLLYKQTKGFEESYEQLRLAAYFLKMAGNQPVRDVSLVENTLSTLFLIWEEADSILVHGQRQLELLEREGNIESTVTALTNLGVAKELKDELEDALFFYDQALTIYLRDSLGNRPFIATNYRNRAYIYTKQENWNSALRAIDIGIQINNDLPPNIPATIDRAELLMTKGYVLYLKKEYSSSIENYEEAICQIIDQTELDNCDIDHGATGEFEQIFSLDNRVLLLGLGYRAKGMAKAKQHQKAKSAFTLAINYLNKIRREYNDTESKLKLTEIAKVIFEGAIALHLDPAVNEPEKAFAYAEQSRAFTLLEGVKHSKAMRIAKVPTALLDQEYQARADIARLERQYLSAKTPEEKTERLQAIRSEKEALNTLMSKLQRNKEYRKLMSFEAPAVKKLRRKALGMAQTLVEYFVGEEKTYVFVLPKKGRLKVLQLEVGSKALNQQVDEFWSSIYHYGCDQEVLQREAPALADLPKSERQAYLKATYRRTGQELYRLLFQPIVDLGTGERFIIIPDEGLSYLPFDALLQGEPEIDNFSFYPYLGRDYTLSYAYSGNLLLEMQGGRSSNARKILAMAPSFSSRQLAMNKSALARLTNNETEINVICDIFSDECDPKSGEAASRETFLDLIKDNAYRIIHLSTHGKANDKNPNQSWISFTQKNQRLDESELLYASDLYALPIQADLVVLSACETNKGRLRRGEGIMSFARGLSAAGVKSVLSTFWVIGEDPSLLVMKDFYQALNAGAAKDVALQKARLGLMENSDFSHPFYWSAFVPIGQMSEVETRWNGRWVLIVFLGFLLVLVFSKASSRRI